MGLKRDTEFISYNNAHCMLYNENILCSVTFTKISKLHKGKYQTLKKFWKLTSINNGKQLLQSNGLVAWIALLYDPGKKITKKAKIITRTLRMSVKYTS